MTDRVTTSTRQRFVRFDTTANNEDERFTASKLRRFGDELKRRKQITKEIEKKNMEQSLYQIKRIASPSIKLSDEQSFSVACTNCVPVSLNNKVTVSYQYNRNIRNILQINSGRKSRGILDCICPIFMQCLRVKKFIYTKVFQNVLNDERVRVAIEQATKELFLEKQQFIQRNSDKCLDEKVLMSDMMITLEKRAKQILLDMQSNLSDLLLRITSWILYRLLPVFLSGVIAHPSQLDMLKAVAKTSPNVPLIFLPLHRSHLDYILVSFILLNNNIRCPVVAAGNNLRIPFFGAALRGLGAFYIKRKIDPITGKKDLIYRAVLHTYMQKILSIGHNMEIFIEGGRTRTGKPCIPKSGILSVIVDAYCDRTISDALLVPVSINYERLVDGHFVNEQMGRKKIPETFRSAASAIWHILQSKYGLMRMDFGEPVSLKDLVKSFNNVNVQNNIALSNSNHLISNPQQKASTSSLYGTDVVQEEQRALVDSIARHIVYDSTSITAVMSTNAVAFLLLTRFRNGTDLKSLSAALDNLRITLKSQKTLGFSGQSKDVVIYATALLGQGLISVEKRGSDLFIKPILEVSKIIELSYYSSSLLPNFALEAIIITAFLSLVSEFKHNETQKDLEATKDDLIQKSLELCDIFRYEFIVNKPCQKIQDAITDTISSLCMHELLLVPEVRYTEQEKWSRRRYAEFEDSDDEYGNYSNNIQVEIIYLSKDRINDYVALNAVIAPFSYTYLAVAYCLNSLLDTNMVELEFIELCVREITNRVDSNECKYGESISTDSIRNCIRVFEKWNIIEISYKTCVRLVSLGDSYNSIEGIQSITRKFQNIIVDE